MHPMIRSPKSASTCEKVRFTKPTILTTNWTAEFATRTTDTTKQRSTYFGNYDGKTGLSIERQNANLRLWYANAPNITGIAAHGQNEATVFSALCAPTTQTVYKDGKLVWSVVTNLTAVNKMNTTVDYCIGGDSTRNMMVRAATTIRSACTTILSPAAKCGSTRRPTRRV